MRRTVALGALVVCGAAVFAAARGATAHSHTLHAIFAGALNLAPGQEVRLAGSRVGAVERVRPHGGAALVTLRIDDARAWPLARSTTARLRWGSTTSYAGRFVQLVPGRRDGRWLADGATLPLSRTTAPVEFDQMYTILNRTTRPQVRALLAELASTLEPRQDALRRALRSAPGALSATGDVMAELGRDEEALNTVVDSGDRATSALARTAPQLQRLVDHLASTFDELARHTAPMQRALDLAPGTLEATRAALGRVDGSIPGLDALVADLRPGAARLTRLAPAVRTTTHELLEVAPIATSALRRARGSTPDVTRLLAVGTPFSGRARDLLKESAPVIGCLRPYAPEIAGLGATWGDFNASYDATGHFARIMVGATPIPNGTSSSPAQTIAANPQLGYAMPRPPGENVGQPWYQPQCGVTRDALDPANDAEGAP